MTRQELSDKLMAESQGFDGGYGYDSDLGDDAFEADSPVSRAGLSSLLVVLSVANAAAMDVNVFDGADLAAAALPTGITSPAIASYRAIIRYLQANPAQLHSIVIQSNEAASTGAPVLSGMTIAPTRVTPFSSTISNQQSVQTYQTTQDFQANRVTIPLAAIMDTVSYLRFQTGTNSTGNTVTFNVNFLFGRRAELRKSLKRGAPVTVRPGGRGVVALKKG